MESAIATLDKKACEGSLRLRLRRMLRVRARCWHRSICGYDADTMLPPMAMVMAMGRRRVNAMLMLWLVVLALSRP